jgi:hypothetical protein
MSQFDPKLPFSEPLFDHRRGCEHRELEGDVHRLDGLELLSGSTFFAC